jgi:hypothetical protein
VSDVLVSAGYAPFDFFSFTPIGSLLLVAGIIFMFVLGRRLLPDRGQKHIPQQMETPAQLFALYRLPDDLFRLRVHLESTVVGSTIESLNPRENFNINILSVTRAGRTIHHPPADLVLQQHDQIMVQGKGNDVGKAAAFWKLGILANQPVQEGDVITKCCCVPVPI